MTQPKKLIEVAMPIKEISAESVRDKSIRHGHISTLHLWWARRPLPVCRAVVFASLVPDPLDVNCPQAFRDAIEILLGIENNFGDPYHPYNDIPWTAVFDPMEDNLRNRLQMFIGKFTEDMQQSLLHNAVKPAAKNLLSDNSLIKWDNKNDEVIIGKARKLIFVSHQCTAFGSEKSAEELLKKFDVLYGAIKLAEQELYSLQDRHTETEKSKQLTEVLHNAIESFLDKMPKVFDPFAGGGAIPLEAARLGCRSFGNDINPVAHIIQKGSVEFPQKYGKPIIYSKAEFIRLYSEEHWNNQPQENKVVKSGDVIGINITNRLSFDVEFYAKKLLAETEKEIGHLYPADEKGNKPIAYYWARVGTCSNPSCKAEVPLLRNFYLCEKPDLKIYLNPIIIENKIEFEIKTGTKDIKPWMKNANLICPCCGSLTDVKNLRNQFIQGTTSEKILAIIWDSRFGREYKLPGEEDLNVFLNIKENIEKPNEELPIEYTGKFPRPWGLKTWGDMFTKRQLLAMTTIVKKLNLLKAKIDINDDYNKAIFTYLSIWVDRIAMFTTSFGLWKSSIQAITTPFGRQAMPMVFDFPEANFFSFSGGGALGQLDWLIRYFESESDNCFVTLLKNASSGEKAQFNENSITTVVTDPPYYDAIGYADISDFFYVWMKRTLGDVFPLNFATPATPKTEECTALKHYHEGDIEKAKKHFERKLLEIFDAIEFQTSDLVSIMFAHQSTEAWTTLCNSILGARLNITGSWAMDTERSSRSLALAKAALDSSVTVSCKPSQRNGIGNYKEVKKAIENKVLIEVEELYSLGFRGADLLTACFGQAVSEFGKYEKVEKADGTEVTVTDLLEMARESAFNALLKGFDGDDFTKFYIGWLQLYSFTESDFDDAAKFSRVGLSINVQELFTEHILIKNGNKQTLGGFQERICANKNLGEKSNSFLIDQVHRGMALFKGNNRGALLQYIAKIAAQPESSFWRVLTSICELLPNGCEDHKQAIGLLANKDSLIRESKTVQPVTYEQVNLFE